MIRIHRAGINVLLGLLMIQAIILGFLYLLCNPEVLLIVSIVFLLFFLFVFRFFRNPIRRINFSENEIAAPADGEVVAIEEIDDKEFTGEKRVQVSIFMTIWNVHINWIPLVGRIESTKHFDGNFMVAHAPKSSVDNERTVTLIKSKANNDIIVVKQIAGAVARRILTYKRKGDNCVAGDELGFIRFGSRVDVLLPTNYKITTKLKEKTVGGVTIIAKM